MAPKPNSTLLIAAAAAAAGLVVGYLGSNACAENKKKKAETDSALPSKIEWVAEEGDFEGVGIAQSFAVTKLLHSEQSPFQRIKVYATQNFGNLMTLDGIFQNTEVDEFSYHEMITHVPMFAHPNPKKVLIIGGGDCGAVRECVKHPGVTEVHLVEIDKRVTDLSKEFFQGIAAACDDPRLTCKFEDASKYVKDAKWTGYYDVVIVDSSDPIGPNAPLFRAPFYRDLHRVLAPDGVAVCQGECLWLHSKTIRECMGICRSIFSQVEYFTTSIPVYPCGIIGFLALAKSGNADLKHIHPDRVQLANTITTKYYTPEIHGASFVKPRFFHDSTPILRNM